jgi:hypothetical protein
MPYKISPYLGVWVIICYIDSFLILTYPILYFIYDVIFNLYVIAFGSPIMLLIIPYFIRKVISEDELISYIETLDKKKLNLFGSLFYISSFIILFLSFFFFLKYLIDVKVPYFFIK